MILYIDPGTGSMLFSLLIGLTMAVSFGLRALIIKLKFVFTGGRVKDDGKKLNFVIFSDHKRYWNVFKTICDEVENRGMDLTYLTMSEDDPVFKTAYKHVSSEYIGSGNNAFARLNMLKAHIVLSTTPGLGVYQWKRSSDVDYYVHVPHVVSDLSDYRMFGLDNYDCVLTTGDNQMELIRKLESLRPGIKSKALVNTGCTYMDGLKSKLKDVCKNEAPVVLVAPSWGVSSILNKYGSSFLNSLKKTSYRIIVRPHPQSLVSEKEMLSKLMEEFKDIEWNFDNDNFDVLNKADILISDFSGVMFDFSLVFNKPIIYADTHFDSSVYDAAWLEEDMWSLRVLPKLGTQLKEEDFGNLEAIITEQLNSTSLLESRKEVCKECWSNMGNSSKLILDYLESV